MFRKLIAVLALTLSPSVLSAAEYGLVVCHMAGVNLDINRNYLTNGLNEEFEKINNERGLGYRSIRVGDEFFLPNYLDMASMLQGLASVADKEGRTHNEYGGMILYDSDIKERKYGLVYGKTVDMLFPPLRPEKSGMNCEVLVEKTGCRVTRGGFTTDCQ